MATIQGQFKQVIFSPKGGIEGVLLSAEGESLQIVFEKHDEESPAAFESVREGQSVVVAASLAEPSPKGKGEHPVYAFEHLVSVDGRKPAKQKAHSGPAYQGKVVRLNYARHGAANGVVLDSGDFIHTKPEGMATLKLKVGDAVRADGDAHLLTTGKGWAVEATTVNGESVSPH